MPQGIDERLEYNQCQDAVRRLTEYLSHELQPQEQEAVEQHLHECRGCFARFHFEKTLLQTIHNRLLEVHAPAALRERIMADLVATEAEPPISPP